LSSPPELLRTNFARKFQIEKSKIIPSERGFVHRFKKSLVGGICG